MKILISSTQYPGNGGAATNAYNLIKYLQSKNYNCCGLFFLSNNEMDFDINPLKLPGIFKMDRNKININDYRENIKKKVINFLGGNINVCFAKNYLAPYLCKNIFNCYTVHLVAGLNNPSCQKLSAEEILKNKINDNINQEILTNQHVDLIVCNSKLLLSLYIHLYKSSINKILPIYINTSFYSMDKYLSENNEKNYDLMICSSRLDRPIKNNKILIDILENNNNKKIIIGSNNNDFLCLKNSEFIENLENNEIKKKLLKTKICLISSLNEANSNLLWEAYSNNCIPLISKNIGFFEFFPKFCIVNSFNKKDWLNSINKILNNYEFYSEKLINHKNNFKNNKFNFEYLLKKISKKI